MMTDPSAAKTKTRFPVIIGPTASGKTALALALAHAVGGPERAEIVTADAFQIYKGLDIGTAKPTPAEQAQITHHLLDIVEPTDRFTVAQWLAAADAAIADIRARGKLPIVVGGTHLYIKALIDGLFEGPEPDPALRAAIAQLPQLQRRTELELVDPVAAERIHPADERRTIRALEVFRQTGTPISTLQTQWRAASPDAARHDCLLAAIHWPTPELNRRINDRVRDMMSRGLEAEVRSLFTAGRLGPQAREALGYKQLVEHVQGHLTLDDAVEQIKIQTRRLGKNQRTWVRRLAIEAGPRGLAVAGGSEPTEAAEMILRACRN